MRIKYLLAFATFALLLGSCVKNRGVNLAQQGSPSPNAVDFPYQKQSVSFDIVDTPIYYTFYVRLESADNSQPATTVTIAPYPDVVTAAGQQLLPDSAFQLVNTTAKVDPATGFAAFQLKVFSRKIDLTGNYALGYKLVSTTAGLIANNKSTILISIGAKNRWDGVYEMKGHHNRSPYNFPYDVTESLVTVNGNTVAMYWDAAASVGHPIGTGPGVVSWYGAAIAPNIVFDPVTNLVTSVYNTGGATPITMFTGAGAGVSRFDPVNKIVYVYWNYNNNPNRAFFDTLYFQHAR